MIDAVAGARASQRLAEQRARALAAAAEAREDFAFEESSGRSAIVRAEAAARTALSKAYALSFLIRRLEAEETAERSRIISEDLLLRTDTFAKAAAASAADAKQRAARREAEEAVQRAIEERRARARKARPFIGMTLAERMVEGRLSPSTTSASAVNPSSAASPSPSLSPAASSPSLHNPNHPLVIDALTLGGPAYANGLQLNDTVLSVAGEPATSLVQVRQTIARRAVVGGTIEIVVRKAQHDKHSPSATPVQHYMFGTGSGGTATGGAASAIELFLQHQQQQQLQSSTSSVGGGGGSVSLGQQRRGSRASVDSGLDGSSASSSIIINGHEQQPFASPQRGGGGVGGYGASPSQSANASFSTLSAAGVGAGDKDAQRDALLVSINPPLTGDATAAFYGFSQSGLGAGVGGSTQSQSQTQQQTANNHHPAGAIVSYTLHVMTADAEFSDLTDLYFDIARHKQITRATDPNVVLRSVCSFRAKQQAAASGAGGSIASALPPLSASAASGGGVARRTFSNASATSTSAVALRGGDDGQSARMLPPSRSASQRSIASPSGGGAAAAALAAFRATTRNTTSPANGRSRSQSLSHQSQGQYASAHRNGTTDSPAFGAFVREESAQSNAYLDVTTDDGDGDDEGEGGEAFDVDGSDAEVGAPLFSMGAAAKAAVRGVGYRAVSPADSAATDDSAPRARSSAPPTARGFHPTPISPASLASPPAAAVAKGFSYSRTDNRTGTTRGGGAGGGATATSPSSAFGQRRSSASSMTYAAEGQSSAAVNTSAVSVASSSGQASSVFSPATARVAAARSRTLSARPAPAAPSSMTTSPSSSFVRPQAKRTASAAKK